MYEPWYCAIHPSTSYRLCKTKLKTNGNRQVIRKYFDSLDILGARPASSPVKIIESFICNDEGEDEETDLEGTGELEDKSEPSGSDDAAGIAEKEGTRAKQKIQQSCKSVKAKH